ncbi:hypothetical protein AAC387_Pa07g0031 [Persea americana]
MLKVWSLRRLPHQLPIYVRAVCNRARHALTWTEGSREIHRRVRDWVALNHARDWEARKVFQWRCRYGDGRDEGSFDRRRAMEFETSCLLQYAYESQFFLFEISLILENGGVVFEASVCATLRWE